MKMILVLMAACWYWGGPMAGIGLKALGLILAVRMVFAAPGMLRYGLGRQRHI